MIFFVSSLTTYSAKNRAWLKLVDWIKNFEHVLIQDEVSLDALKLTIENQVKLINAEHPKLKQISFDSYMSGRTGQMSARVTSGAGTPDLVFIMDICRVRSTFQFSEDNAPKIEVKKGGRNG